MLLAAGRGERLRPLTDHTAKPLIKARNKPLIEYHLENLCSAGIVEVIINTCWQAEKIVALIGDGSQFGLEVKYSHEPQALETAGGIANALELLGHDPFLVISADTWSDLDLTLIRKPKQTLAHLLLVNNPSHNPAGDFDLKDGLLVKTPDSTLTYSGIGIFEPALFDNLPQPRLALREILYPAISRQQISGEMLQGDWFDIGTVERLAQLDQHLNSNQAF